MSWCLKFKVHCSKCTDFSFVNWFHKLSDRGPMCYGPHNVSQIFFTSQFIYSHLLAFIINFSNKIHFTMEHTYKLIGERRFGQMWSSLY